MSTDLIWTATATEDIDLGVELSDTEHTRDALFSRGPGRAGEAPKDPAPVSDPFPFGGRADHRALATATRRLPPEERRVVRMRLSGHASADAIADALGLTRPRVVLLLDRGLSRVRHDLLT